MKQELINDQDFKKCMDLCYQHTPEFNEEFDRRKKIVSSVSSKEHKEIASEYYDFAKKPEIENYIPHIYVDSQYYLTLGVGHFLGFDKYDFWANYNDTWKLSEMQQIMYDFEKQIKDEKLTDNNKFGNSSDPNNFKNFPQPSDIDHFLSISSTVSPPRSTSSLQALFSMKYACLGYLDAKRIFDPNADQELAFFKTYVSLLGLALKLNARRKALHREYANPFKARAFCVPKKKNEPCFSLEEDRIKSLASEDILVKICETKWRFKGLKEFDTFPHSIKLAIIDLAYTGSLTNEVKELCIKEEWGGLAAKIKNLRPTSNDTRNDQVIKWIKQTSSN